MCIVGKAIIFVLFLYQHLMNYETFMTQQQYYRILKLDNKDTNSCGWGSL